MKEIINRMINEINYILPIFLSLISLFISIFINLRLRKKEENEIAFKLSGVTLNNNSKWKIRYETVDYYAVFKDTTKAEIRKRVIFTPLRDDINSILEGEYMNTDSKITLSQFYEAGLLREKSRLEMTKKNALVYNCHIHFDRVLEKGKRYEYEISFTIDDINDKQEQHISSYIKYPTKYLRFRVDFQENKIVDNRVKAITRHITDELPSKEYMLKRDITNCYWEIDSPKLFHEYKISWYWDKIKE